MTDAIGKGGVYRITVTGELDPDYAPPPGGMSVKVIRERGTAPTVVLEGRLADQAALGAVLDTLYQLHLPVVSVELIEP